MKTNAKVNYRVMLFSFLGDASLTKVQRAVGVVLILRTDMRNGFVSQYRARISWDKIALLSGYTVGTAARAYRDLVGMGWFEVQTRDDGRTRYRLTRQRIELARERQQHHEAQIAAARAAREGVDNCTNSV